MGGKDKKYSVSVGGDCGFGNLISVIGVEAFRSITSLWGRCVSVRLKFLLEGLGVQKYIVSVVI